MKLKKHITDEKTGISYTLQGDYYLPNLRLLEQDEYEIGRFGRAHRRFIKDNRKAFYTSLLLSGKLGSYLHEIDEQCNDVYESMVKSMATNEGVTEQLKADNQMEWVRRMNNIKNRVEEVINAEYVYA